MATITINIAAMAVSDKPEDTLVTYSIGSGLGVTVYDRSLKIGGLVHCMLPLSQTNPEKASQNPSMFVDSGISRLLDEVSRRGCKKTDIIIKVAGCSIASDDKGMFRMAERNYAVLRRILGDNGIEIAAEDVGGSFPRTLSLAIATGVVTVNSEAGEKIL